MSSGKNTATLSRPLRLHLKALSLKLANRLLLKQGLKPLKALRPLEKLGLKGSGGSSRGLGPLKPLSPLKGLGASDQGQQEETDPEE